MNVVDIGAARLARAKPPLDPEIAARLREVDPTMLLSYLANVLPVDGLAFQARFVVDRVAWMRHAADLLIAEADHLEQGG
jgi:hypothetical protein